MELVVLATGALSARVTLTVVPLITVAENCVLRFIASRSAVARVAGVVMAASAATVKAVLPAIVTVWLLAAETVTPDRSMLMALALSVDPATLAVPKVALRVPGTIVATFVAVPHSATPTLTASGVLTHTEALSPTATA